MIVKSAKNWLVKVMIAVPQDNQGNWIPDIYVEVWILGVKVFARRFNL
mgnify:CR=1 FL=1